MNDTNLLNNNFTNNPEYLSYSNYYSNSNYSYNRNYGSNINSSMMYNQVLTMTIIPLITTIFTTFFTSLMTDIKKLTKYILNYYSLKCDKKKLIQYKLYHKDKINDDILPIIWFINKTKSIKEGEMISFEEIIGDKNKINMLLCPIYKKSLNNNDNNNQNTISKSDDKHNNLEDYIFFEINDCEKNKNIFYYGINGNNFCLMSYKASIEEIGEFILDVKNKYNEFKSDIDINIKKEKKLYIEIYREKDKDNMYGSPDTIIVNQQVIPLMLFLNKKKKITEGFLAKITDNINNKKNFIIDNNENVVLPIIKQSINNDLEFNDDEKNNKEKKKYHSNKNNDCNKLIEVEKNIFCSFGFKKNKLDHYPYIELTKEYIIISSEKYSISELLNWIENINNEYKKYIESKNKIKYLYTLTSGESSNLFVKSLLDETQTFEHLFFDKKKEILNDIQNFLNIEFYKKFGMKRKLGYLLVGPPGSGKTALVTAISNLLGRSLKNIPISLIKTNSEFEKAYGELSYDNQMLKSDEIVITFDEIDSAYDSQKLTKNITTNNGNQVQETKSESQSNIPVIVINNDKDDKKDCNPIQSKISNLNKDDSLNIGIVLSKLDGNENQEGSVIIATCNDISRLDPALYRNGRLKLIELNYAGREEISQMIEKYCEIVLDNEQKNKVRNDCKVQTLNIKHTIAKYLLDKNFSACSDNIDEIIELINDL